jgi:tRNA-specific 2-thiouridylase
VRYRSEPVGGEISLNDDGTADVELVHPVRAITPGQAAVFYKDDEVFGAGTILNVKRVDQ